MGILNVTPDSFSDGAQYLHVDDALRHAEAMVSAGADIIDVGGESTRPGALPITSDIEMERVCPVVERICQNIDVMVSVDTSCPDVMSHCAQLGASMINDVRALERPGAIAVAAKTGLAVCLMHHRGEPTHMMANTEYDDLLTDVHQYLQARVQVCESAGISRQRLMIDPGIGFAKNQAQNLYLLKHLSNLKLLDLPILIGASRKRLIGQVLQQAQASDRMAGSIGLAIWAAIQGASVIRVHDVLESVQAIRMVDAVRAASELTDETNDLG